MSEQTAIVRLSTINTLLQYLGTRPYQEVFNIIKVITDEVSPQLKNEPVEGNKED